MKSTLIRLRLRLDTPGGVTAPESLDAPDETLVLRTDTAGDPHLPGTTVAGSLRAHCAAHETLKPTEQRTDLFGGTPGSKQRTASPIQILGTIYRPAGDTELRRRTAIHRERGGPENHKLHTIELLPSGTEFDIVLRWDNPDDRYETFIEELRSWRPQLGRGGSIAAGFCTATGVGQAIYDLATPDGLLAWLSISSPSDYPEPKPSHARSSAPQPVIDVELEIVDGIHIGIGESEEDDQAKPKINKILRSGEDFLVPGSTLKGVLRSRAEYICRALGARSCTDQTCGACTPCRLFGFTGKDGNAQRAKIAIHDAIISDPVLELRQHVALDRFTGGAADRQLYTDEVITSGRFRLRIGPLQLNLTPTERLLLNAVLTDLDDGLIGIGARTTAGLGTVRIASPEWTTPDARSLATLLISEATA